MSSGQLHRKTENEWVPVSPKKSQEPVPVPKPVEAPAVKEVKENATPAAVVPGPQVFPQAATDLVSPRIERVNCFVFMLF